MEPWRVVGAGYDAIGERYHAWSHADPDRLAYVVLVRDRLPAGARVLDLGCGPGDPATRLLAERHHVVGVDLSAGQLAIARVKAPGAVLVRADMTRLAVRPASLDAVVSFFAFGHLPSAAHAPLLTSIGGWLRPGGVFVASVPLSPGDGSEPDWLGVPMLFGGIGRDATLAAIAAGGLTVESVERRGPQGETFDWVVAARGEAAVRGRSRTPRRAGAGAAAGSRAGSRRPTRRGPPFSRIRRSGRRTRVPRAAARP